MPFCPTRLVVARKRRRMTLSTLSAKSGVLVRSITAYENSRTTPTPESLESLAKALDFPIQFFHLGEVEELPSESLSFRAMSKMTAGQRDAARSSAVIASLIAEWVADRFDAPSAALPTLGHLPPEEAATNLRGLWELGEAPIGNLLHLVESKGIRVFSLAADCRDVDAFCTPTDGTPLIFLNLAKSGERGRFDLAHELGHLVMHGESRSPHGPDAEQEAQRFASAFLMPRADIISSGLTLAKADQILAAKHRWKVSAMALNYRLRDLDLLTEWLYSSNARSLAQMGYRRSEPGGIARETSLFWRKVVQQLALQRVGWSRLSEDLGLPVEELNAHLFGLVPLALRGGNHATSRGEGEVRTDLRLVSGQKGRRAGGTGR